MTELHSEEEFQRLYKKAQSLLNLQQNADIVESPIESSGPRPKRHKRVRKTLYDMGFVVDAPLQSGQYEHSKESEMRKLFFQAIDIILNSFKERFDQPDLKLLRTVENIVLDAANDNDVQVSCSPSRVKSSFIKLPITVDFDKLAKELN